MTRHLTVLGPPMTRRGSRLEIIGQWLVDAGFRPGQCVRIDADAGTLTITTTTAEK